MRGSIFDYVSNLDTLIAVIIGAFLATGGALVAEIIQDRLNRKRQERDAARFFGEILSSIDRILDFAFRSQGIGNRWGSVTERLFKTAMREAAVYERNRERLFDIHDAELRSRIHNHFLVETVPLQAIIEIYEKIYHLDERLKMESQAPVSSRQQLLEEIADLHESLEGAHVALVREHAKTADICADLERIGQIKFDESRNTDTLAQRATAAFQAQDVTNKPDTPAGST